MDVQVSVSVLTGSSGSATECNRVSNLRNQVISAKQSYNARMIMILKKLENLTRVLSMNMLFFVPRYPNS